MRSAAPSPRWRTAKARGAIAVGRDGRTHSRHARSRAGPRPHRRRHRRRADRHGPVADALFRDPLSRRRRRHPGHRQPQPGRLQRLQDAAEGPLGVRRRRSRSSASAPPPATGPRATARSRKSTSARPMSTGCSQDFSGKAVPHRLGRRQRRRRAGPRHAGRAAARASITSSSPRSTALSPTTTPTRRSKPTSPT